MNLILCLYLWTSSPTCNCFNLRTCVVYTERRCAIATRYVCSARVDFSWRFIVQADVVYGTLAKLPLDTFILLYAIIVIYCTCFYVSGIQSRYNIFYHISPGLRYFTVFFRTSVFYGIFQDYGILRYFPGVQYFTVVQCSVAHILCIADCKPANDCPLWTSTINDWVTAEFDGFFL